jgi:5,10-methenyltetrahydrofolate synthetase
MPLTPELARWRKAERAALIARRQAAPAADHARWSAAIEALLRRACPFGAGWTVGLCWPFQAEFDARPVAEYFRAAGARLALPAVVAKAQPLEFREWWPGATLTPGVYGLLVPEGTATLTPDALLVPPVGIGAAGDRLGYGGGFFDRTLAALAPRPLTFAHAFELSRLPTTFPQPHDILMDFVVTEAGVEAAVAGGLRRLTPEECRAEALILAARRGLPRPRVP